MPAAERKDIVLIEDCGDDEALMVRALKKSGVEANLTVLRDGQEALNFLFPAEASGEALPLPNLVLLDLKIPKIDGTEVLKQIRDNQRTRYLNVVVLTSSREEKDLIRCYDLGANSYVRKPLDFAAFTGMMAKICEYWLTLNESPQGKA